MSGEQFGIGGDELKKVISYEGEHLLPYSELGKDATFDCWGSSVVTKEDGLKEWMSFYNDPRVTERLFADPLAEHLAGIDSPVIADLGGGEGQMLAQIVDQLKQKGIDPVPVLSEIDFEKLKMAREQHPEIQSVQADAFDLPFADGSVDALVSRMFMQYNRAPSEVQTEPNQYDLLKEMYRIMKDNSTGVIVWPGSYSDPNVARYNDAFWNHLTWSRTDKHIPGESIEESRKRTEETIGWDNQRRRCFTQGEVMVEYAKKAGFVVASGEEIDWIEFRYTADAIINRFRELQNPENEANLKWVREAFKPGHYSGIILERLIQVGGDVTEWNGEKAVRLPISRLILQKS